MVKGMNTHKNNGREIDSREIIILEQDKHMQNGGFESFLPWPSSGHAERHEIKKDLI
jgi:hypothetical protein